MLLDLWRFVAEICRCFIMFSPYHPLGLIHLNSTAKKKHWWRWSQAKWFPQNWHGIAAAAKSQRYISRLRPRDASAIWQVKIQEIEFRRAGRACDGCWYRAMPKFKVAQSGRIFMQNSCCPCFEVQLDRKQNLTFNMHVCNVCRRQPGMTCGVVPQNCPWIGCLNPHFFSIKFGAKLPPGTCFPMCVGALRKLERMRWSWIAVWAKLGAPNIRMVAALDTKYIKLWKSGG